MKTEYDAFWDKMELNDSLRCDVYLNGLGNRYEGDQYPANIKALLAGQLYGKVYWHDCVVKYLENNIDRERAAGDSEFEIVFVCIEVGPHKISAKLIDQIVKILGLRQAERGADHQY